jgi:phage baseplate assembly protein W
MAISGLEFPLRISRNGAFAVVEENTKIRQNLERIANTALRERFYEPNMGSVGYKTLFRNQTESTASAIASLVAAAIAEQENRVVAKVASVTDSDEGTLELRIQYYRIDTREVDSFGIRVNT